MPFVDRLLGGGSPSKLRRSAAKHYGGALPVHLPSPLVVFALVHSSLPSFRLCELWNGIRETPIRGKQLY